MTSERRFVMGSAIALRPDFDGTGLRRLARASKDAGQTRRLLALAVIYDGGRRGDAAEVGGVGLQVIRDWVLRFNAEGPAGLIDRKAPGARPKLNDGQRRALARRGRRGSDPSRRRRCALAAEGPGGLAPRGVRRLSGREVGEPRVESSGVLQADGPSAPPCPERTGHGGL